MAGHHSCGISIPPRSDTIQQVAIAHGAHPSHPTLVRLSACYGLPTMQAYPPTSGVQTIKQEFASYVTANSSLHWTDPILFCK